MWSALTRNRRLGMLAAGEARAVLGVGGVVPAVERYVASAGRARRLPVVFTPAGIERSPTTKRY